MKILMSNRLQSLGFYPFAAVDEATAKLLQRGITPINFGIGDHTLPCPDVARDRLKRAVDECAATGYPSYAGSQAYRQAIADWLQRRFNVTINPDTQISSTIGSKEAIFNLPKAFINPGDTVIVPTPGYLPFHVGTLFAGGKPFFVPLSQEHQFLINFDDIPSSIAESAKLLWICYPNAPTGVQAPPWFFERAIEFCRKHNILLCSDEAYIDIYFDDTDKPRSILEFTQENVLAVFSMSKRSMMTGWRIGWIAGDPDAVSAFKKLKTNIDSGTPNFIQSGAIAALEDEWHVKEMRDLTKQKCDILADALVEIGLEDCRPQSTLFLWQKVPARYTSESFAQALLNEEIAIVTTPGSWLGQSLANGFNPGEGYVRFALVPPLDQVKEAATRFKKIKI
jgi:LL-diaminopimelate aminotransferase